MESDEAKLKRLFHELKSSDERRAPTFAETFQAAESRTAETARAIRWLARPVIVAAAVLVIALGVVALLRARTPRVGPQMPLALSEWQSPTEFLLNTTDRTLLTSVPKLDQSWMQDMTYLNEQIE